MEPRIQYVKTSDGVRIAYFTLGEGTPLLYTPPAPQHVQLEWEFPDIRRAYEWLAAKHKLIRIDRRNTGLSQREVEDVSFEARGLDIEAVADRLGLDRFHMLAHGQSANTAVAFAASHPGRIRRLVLLDAYLELPDVEPTAAVRAVRDVVDHDFETYTEMLAGIVWGWGEQTHQYAGLLRESVTWEETKRRRLSSSQIDYYPILAQITAPTLVVHHIDAVGTPVEIGRRLATEIADARFVALEGRSVGASLADPRMMAAVDQFLSEGEEASGEAEPSLPSGMTAILFADIADSTALTERLGDAAFRAKARDVAAVLRSIIAESGGKTIEGPTLGDGVLATFTSARQAIEAALACARAGADGGLPLHLGLHAGDVTREKDPDGRDNVYGGAVNIAARISGLSAPGEVLVSATMRDLARTSAGVSFEDRGEQALKGIDDPVRVFAVR